MRMGDNLVTERHDAAYLPNVRMTHSLIVVRSRMVNLATCDFGVNQFVVTWQKENGSFVRSLLRCEYRAR
jgi:hypothetical protein